MSTAFFNAVPRKSLVTHVEDEIKNALIEGRLEPGTRLVTRDLAESLGMSITPVREALVRFAASGILTAEPAQSFRVPTLSVAQYSEISEIRKAVEGLAAARAAAEVTTEEIGDLEVLLAQYLAAKSAQDQHLALARNKEFRFLVYSASRMPTLLGVIETLWLRAGPGFNYLYPEEHVVFSEHHNYDRLLQALRDRTSDAARHAIEHAIDDGARRVIAALEARAS